MKESKTQSFYRPTWAQISLSHLAYNFRQIKGFIPAGVKVMAMVKADAYGHGLVKVAQTLEKLGVDYLGVASVEEGIRLRQAKIKVPILVLGTVFGKDVPAVFDFRLSLMVCSYQLLSFLEKEGRRRRQKAVVHVKIDTGMGRLGMLYTQAVDFIEHVLCQPHIFLEGVFTHLACADSDKEITRIQLARFRKIRQRLVDAKINVPLYHCANSAGIINFPESLFDMVRPGLILYGLRPTKNIPFRIKPVLSLKSKVVFCKKVPAGYGISYGHTYITKKETSIAVLPLGYGDGYPRNLSNLGPVLIGGRRFRISGRVCMDQVMVDVGDFPLRIGQEAVFIGSQKDKAITVEEIAELAQTIPYEIVCGLGSRIPRIYDD